MISFFVHGFPRTKGSLAARHRFKPDGRCQVWLMEQNDKELRWWRTRIKEAGKAAMEGAEPLAGMVYLGCTFYFPPDTALYGAQRHDLDKLTRALMDSLTDAGVYHDDSQVAQLEVHKTFMDHQHELAGAAVSLEVMA